MKALFTVNKYDSTIKRLLDGMKFQWPAKQEEVKQLTLKQVQWLFDGLSIEQKKAHHAVKINGKHSCF